jgi:gluconolactonase
MRAAFAVLLLACVSNGQPFTELKVERVGAGYRFTEGPAWSPQGFLVFSDVPNNRIWKIVSGKAPEVFREASEGANGNTFDSKGNLYTCESRSRRVTRTSPKGEVEVLAGQFEGKRFNAPNDIVVRKDGHAWFTDPAFGNQQEGAELGFFGIYHLSPKGELRLVARRETRPNGITLSPNGRILYVADSDARTVIAWDADRNGATTNERIVIRDIEGVPDGIRTDEKGNLWVTCKGVAVYSPGGKLLQMIEVPETPANIAFGDPDLATLYVTARTSVYRIYLPVKGATP